MSNFAVMCARALYLFAPLLFSAVISGIVLRFDLFPRLAAPIDGGHCFRGRRIFGDGKTWRGVVVAVTGCIGAVAVQKQLTGDWVRAIRVVDYASVPAIAFGAAMGFGAMLGELPNSFLKRRLGIARGETAKGSMGIVFYLADQLDLLAGAWPMIAVWVRPSIALVAASVVVTLVAHPLVALVGYWVGARTKAR
jgi:hypothetical protein